MSMGRGALARHDPDIGKTTRRPAHGRSDKEETP
jgi:hypothetical protein